MLSPQGSFGLRALRNLWLFFALTVPLLGVEFLRLENVFPAAQIAVPMVLLVVIIFLGSTMYLAGDRVLHRPVISEGNRALIAMIALFGIWHLFRLLGAVNLAVAMRETVKMWTGIVCLWGMLAFFPRDEAFMRRFWKWVLFSSGVILAVLIYRYAFVFRAAYLGSHWGSVERAGRNQLAWYLVFALSYAIVLVWAEPRRLWAILILIVLVGGCVYVGSRGAWVAIVAAILYSFPSLVSGRGIGRKRAFSNILRFSVLIGLVAAAVWWWFSTLVDVKEFEFIHRLLVLFQPGEDGETGSSQKRYELLLGTWECFQRSPIVGVGIRNTAEFCLGGLPSHNDYVEIFSDLGIVGGVLFLGIVFSFWRKIVNSREFKMASKSSWVYAGTRMGFVGFVVSLLFLNGYTVFLPWFFLGFALVAYETERCGRAVSS